MVESRKINLTDRTLKAAKPRPASYDIRDAVVPGLRARVLPGGQVTFVLLTRFGGGSSNPTRRALGVYGQITLAAAREKARVWLDQLGRGIDPAADEERRRQAELRQQRTTFGVVAEEYITKRVSKTAKAHETAQDIQRELVSRWGRKPIADVTRHDVIGMAEEIAGRGTIYQAHNVLGHVRGLFNWAINRGAYGIETSPCDRLRPADLIGKKAARSRTLTDTEIKALWQVAAQLAYPAGDLVRLLLVTGQRRNECADAQWREFDLGAKAWLIPAARMKAAAPHLVPLSDLAIELLRTLPRFTAGDFLFSYSFGRTPFNSPSKLKVRLDQHMAEALGYVMPAWVLHDIRRTVRSQLSALCPSEVAELVIAHARPGLRAVYDLHSFEAEKRKALDLWSARLRDIVEPPPANVVPLREAVS
jgi:integrase